MAIDGLDVRSLLRLGSRPAEPGRPRPAGADRIPYLPVDAVRSKFLAFYEGKGHAVLPSFGLVPRDDPSILWINCGMAPLKPYFQGLLKPLSLRLASSQKSVRLNDIENVGLTPRHHTFFEMLGNFSIGDYFKREAILWAWELVTEVFRLPPELLVVTVHPTDEEARSIWRAEVGLSEASIVEDETNFWDIGLGPCGPNSEIHIDRGPALGCGRADCGPLCGCGRYLEFYNLVFTQFNHNEDGSRTPLPRKNIDTGMGLERMASITQGVASNFEADVFWPLIAGACQLLGLEYGADARRDLALRIIVDHVRSVVFLVGDGPLPSNEGRGYVIRRLIRRAARYGLSCGAAGSFLHQLVPLVAGLAAAPYPELLQRAAYLEGVVKQEEERFAAALGEGMRIAGHLVAAASREGGGVLSGQAAFQLYDTFGFPLDLTEDLAKEANLSVDRAGFERRMTEQRQRARAARQVSDGWESAATMVAEALGDQPPTRFLGYELLSAPARVLAIVAGGERVGRFTAGEGREAYVLLDETPFYAASGGQVADTGLLEASATSFLVSDTQRLGDGQIVHLVSGGEGQLCAGDLITARVDALRRVAIARNHTATHLLHMALKQVLGPETNQAGSLVAADRLRFDFTSPRALADQELLDVERRANEAVLADLTVTALEMPLDEARATGAIALFGERYGERVRVVSAEDCSRELCGGTHVRSTGQIGLIYLLGESGIGSGVRRLEAVTGHAARETARRDRQILEGAASLLRVPPEQLTARIEELAGRIREAERRADSLRLGAARGAVEEIVRGAREFAPGHRVAYGRVEASGLDELRRQVDLVRERVGPSGVGVLAAEVDGKAAFVVSVGAALVDRGLRAGDVAKRVAALVGGSGGGRPEMAQAGARDPALIEQALAALPRTLGQMVEAWRKG